MTDRIRVNLDISGQLDSTIDEIAEYTKTSRAEIFRKSIALLKIFYNTKRDGKHLGIVSDSGKLDTEIVGL